MSRGPYKYIGGDIDDIVIYGDIMPQRADKSVLRGEDVVYLMNKGISKRNAVKKEDGRVPKCFISEAEGGNYPFTTKLTRQGKGSITDANSIIGEMYSARSFSERIAEYGPGKTSDELFKCVLEGKDLTPVVFKDSFNTDTVLNIFENLDRVKYYFVICHDEYISKKIIERGNPVIQQLSYVCDNDRYSVQFGIGHGSIVGLQRKFTCELSSGAFTGNFKVLGAVKISGVWYDGENSHSLYLDLLEDFDSKVSVSMSDNTFEISSFNLDYRYILEKVSSAGAPIYNEGSGENVSCEYRGSVGMWAFLELA